MFAALGCRGGDEVVAELNLCEGGLRAHRSQWTVALPVFRALGHDPHYRRDSHMAELRRRRDELLQLLARTRGQKEILVPRFDPPTRALLPGSDWVKWGTVAAGVLAAALLAWSGRGTLARWLQEAGEAVRGLLGRGAEQFRGILATMRRDRQFEVVPPGTLMRERESLGRMVGEYTGSPEAAERAAASGDCAVIMPDFEAAIRHPIASVVTGPLARLLFIQIQKAKCDVAMSLSAVDRLVSANEVNFQIISATPIVIIFYGAAALVLGALTGRNPLNPRTRKFRSEVASLLRFRINVAELGVAPATKEDGRYLLKCANTYALCDRLGSGRTRGQRTCLQLAAASTLPVAAAIVQAHAFEAGEEV